MTRTSTLGLPTSFQAIWKPRGEDIEQLAARMVSWAEGMRELDPRFANWHPDMNSRRTAITRPFDLTDESVAKSLILKYREMSDGPDPVPIPGWGFSPSAWTPMAADDDADVGFLTSVGKATDSPSHFFEMYKFNWSQSAPFANDWELTAKAIHVVAKAWDPLHCECAGYWHPKAKQHRVRWDVRVPAVGWMLYLLIASLADRMYRQLQVYNPAANMGHSSSYESVRSTWMIGTTWNSRTVFDVSYSFR